MNVDQKRQVDMLKRLVQYKDDHSDLFQAGTPAADAFGDVSRILARIDEQETSRARVEGEGRHTRKEARRVLVSHMSNIRRMAGVLKIDTPPAGDAFVLPRRQGDAALLATARAFAADAAPLAARFIAGGLPETFLADFQSAVDAFDRAVGLRTASRAARSTLRNGIKSSLADGLTAARRLDAIVLSTLDVNDQGRVTWREHRRIGPSLRRTAVVPTTTTTPAVTTVAHDASPPETSQVRPSSSTDRKEEAA